MVAGPFTRTDISVSRTSQLLALQMTDHRSSTPVASEDERARDADSDYVVVARRYRPQTFDQLIGQEHVSKALMGAISTGRVGHAYLFTGARGVGKTSAARILAKALNCAQGTSSVPCNQCEVCLSVSNGDDVDVLEIDGASNRGIDEIRQLRQNAAIRPSRSRFKIYIIDEVHMLTKEAFNALLKTLEEPPEHVKFIFATTEPNKIPVTILSRCQRYDFAGIDTMAIQTRLSQIALAEGASIEADALQILAMRASGSMRDSQSLLEQLLATAGSVSIPAKDSAITAAAVTNMLGIAPAARLSRLVQPLVDHDAALALDELDEAIAEGAEVSQLVDQLLGYFRDVMTQTVGCQPNQMLYALPGQWEEVGRIADQLGVQTLLAMVQVLDQAASQMRISTQTRTLAEMALVRLCHLENLDALATLIDEIKRLPPGNQTIATVAEGSVPKRAEGSVPKKAEGSVPKEAEGSCSTPTEPKLVESTPSNVGQTDPTDSRLTPANALRLWQQAVKQVNGLVGDNGALADSVDLTEDRRLVVHFPPQFSTCRDFCERPANREKLLQALEQVVGEPVVLELKTHVQAANSMAPPNPPRSNKQRHAEITSEPFVQRAMELFAGEPGRIRYVPPEEITPKKT